MSIVTSHTHGLVCVKDGLYNLGLITNRSKNCWWFNKESFLLDVYVTFMEAVISLWTQESFQQTKFVLFFFFSSSLSKLKCYKQNNTLLTTLFFFFFCVCENL